MWQIFIDDAMKKVMTSYLEGPRKAKKSKQLEKFY